MPLAQNELAETIISRVVGLADSGVSSPIILIDGRAASGKSTLAGLVQNGLFKELEVAPRVIHMDDLYDGWNGLQAGSDYLLRNILGPVSRGVTANWQEYDWQLEARDRWREFGGGTPLIVEGCGSLSRQTAELASVRVWLD
ncbi:MAG: ATP-binding protein, partial [Micrococcales bacterium]